MLEDRISIDFKLLDIDTEEKANAYLEQLMLKMAAKKKVRPMP